MSVRVDLRSLQKGGRKLWFYLSNFAMYYTPDSIYRWLFHKFIGRLTDEELAISEERASYYAHIPQGMKIDEKTATSVKDYKYPFGEKKKFSAYFFDLLVYIRLFPKHYKFHYLFGDINTEMTTPTLVKSRPIVGRETPSVLCKWDKTRHFVFLHDTRSFREKKDLLIARNYVMAQPHRTRFLEMYINHPLCDVGRINEDNDGHPEFLKPFVSINDHLAYKFICCIEGHDVATNLKWVMSSNSVAVMPRPTIESWFMEATLIPNYHYIEIKSDYSDLIEKLNYYIAHPEEAEAIIAHAHAYVDKFRSPRLERYTSYLTLKKYFQAIGQA